MPFHGLDDSSIHVAHLCLKVLTFVAGTIRFFFLMWVRVGLGRICSEPVRAGFGWFGIIRGHVVCQDRFAMVRADQIPSGLFGAGKSGPPRPARTHKTHKFWPQQEKHKVFSKKHFRFNKKSVCVKTCYNSVLLKWLLRFIKTFYFFRKLFRGAGIRHR